MIHTANTAMNQPNAMNDTRTDTEILDHLADERIFDGINGIDIDEATSHALEARGIHCGAPEDTEDTWKLEWRRQFRLAIMKGMTP